MRSVKRYLSNKYIQSHTSPLLAVGRCSPARGRFGTMDSSNRLSASRCLSIPASPIPRSFRFIAFHKHGISPFLLTHRLSIDVFTFAFSLTPRLCPLFPIPFPFPFLPFSSVPPSPPLPCSPSGLKSQTPQGSNYLTEMYFFVLCSSFP